MQNKLAKCLLRKKSSYTAQKEHLHKVWLSKKQNKNGNTKFQFFACGHVLLATIQINKDQGQKDIFNPLSLHADPFCIHYAVSRNLDFKFWG